MKNDISAIILAAGFSSRMGSLKPLLPLKGQSMLAHAVMLFKVAGVGDIRVVVGHRAEALLPAIEALDARVLVNPRYETGMFSSILTGIDGLPVTQRAFFILPVDIPLVRRRSVLKLMDVMETGEKAILYPTFMGRRGHPPLISTRLATEIRAWSGEGGLRGFLKKRERLAADVPVPDPYVLLDMDTPGDYESVRDAFEAGPIPGERECLALLTRCFDVPEAVLEHCRAVARVADHLAGALNAAGCRVSRALVMAAGFLHDAMRQEPDHARAAARVLREMGYPTVADVVAVHMDISVDEKAPVQADEVVYLADKLVKGARLVGVHERFQSAEKRFSGDPQALAAMRRRLETVRKIQTRFEAASGRSLDAVFGEMKGLFDGGGGP